MSWISSFFTPVSCEAPAPPAEKESQTAHKEDDKAEGKPDEEEPKKEEGGDEEEPAAAEEEEEEEPEDVLPALRDECKEAKNCAPLNKHFQHCEEKVNEGKGFKGEDCVEELLMHCVDSCVAPKLWSKLK